MSNSESAQAKKIPLDDEAKAGLSSGKSFELEVDRTPKATLAVQILFDGQPLQDLNVAFFELRIDGSRGAQIGTILKTGEDGIAKLDQTVRIGRYTCCIDDERDVVVTTVPGPDDPFCIWLPIRTPFIDQ